MNIKKTVKAILPERVEYIYGITRLLLPYIKALRENKKANYPEIRFLSNSETIELITTQKMSLARFGDGELRWMNGEKLDSFQVYSNKLGKELIEAFQNQNPKLIIGIPYGIVDASKCNLHSKMHWEITRKDIIHRLSAFLDKNRYYADASITRPYIDYRDRKYSEYTFELLKRIWNNRNVIVVEGYKTKLGLGNDLLNNSSSIKRILCPSENAFEAIEQIEKSIVKNADKSDLILAALGPTASILASRLCDLGYQIIDIGHVDIEYMWYLKKSLIRVPIEGKYVNEIGNHGESEMYEDNEEYKRSVIVRL